MAERAIEPVTNGQGPADDIDAVTSAVLTASRLLVGISLRSLTAVREQVTLPQFRLLVALATHEDTKLVTLADHLTVNPSTAMRMVERLVAAGLIDRRINPASRREVLLRLTEDGRRLVEEVTARRREELAAIVTAMPADQRARLVEALRAFTDAGGEPPVGETRAWD
ncbi:MarR family transcriptional regulator [Actinoallomurus sp. NPDC052274]|uniref:MarR family winged helix-turn-helix transcriptional regulator n=1 Tax=Actinoallomurus sp. NPDC052274 TaxID=3155420 RepID=UPI003448E5EE